MSDVRVRIAPSPTGNLHVGTARTALFNYLYAKHTGGTFVLRIEDTDLERSDERYTADIFNGLKALGLTWDEGPDVGGPYGPYMQSQRLELYREYAQKLLDSGHAYYCYCTPEELEAEKAKALEEKRPTIYSRRCCNPAVVEQLKQDPSRKPAIRFRIPGHPDTIVLNDVIRGTVTFESALIGDFVIVKSNGIASYNFAVVVDDLTMKISHVIRGEDHVSNTPKQMLLYEALGAPCPTFAHVSMILAPDRSKLSKRHGATAVAEYIQSGYLPDAFCNFLSLLGWSPTDGEDIGTLEKFAPDFTLERISHSPAVYDQEKLNFLNGYYIRNRNLSTLLAESKPFLKDFDLSRYSEAQLELMLGAVREPITTLADLPNAVCYFFGDTLTYSPELSQEVLCLPETIEVLKKVQETLLPNLNFNDIEQISAQVKAFANDLKPIKMKTIMWAIRAAVTGRVHGADLGKTLHLLGPELVKHRVEDALNQIASCNIS